jgi:hypothetical protein
VLALFGLFEHRHEAPLVNVRTFTQRPVLTTNVSTLLIGSAMISTFVLVPQLAQLPDGAGFGFSATEACLLLAPGGIVSMLVAPFVGKLGERRARLARAGDPLGVPDERRPSAISAFGALVAAGSVLLIPSRLGATLEPVTA